MIDATRVRPGVLPAGESSDDRRPHDPPRVVVALRLVAVCLGFGVLSFLQDPGRLVADTKLDLVVNPTGLMSRALHLWEPLGFAGQVQNQGYGYLWPMGPFFALGEFAGLPGWVVQRLWWTLLLALAFVGAERLARALGIGTPWTRLIGALAFALAPRMMTTLGGISSETLPMAIAPWVLLPLVLASAPADVAHRVRGRPMLAGLLSGLALLFAGGINAAATGMVMILPVLWLLTREPGRFRRRLALWWLVGTGLACLWWLIPLLMLGRVSPPFLDYIEGTAVTASPTSPAQVLRGADHWLALVTSEGGVPVWRSGWMLVTVPIVIAYTAIVAAGGIAGLSARRLPERAFLRAGVLTGAVIVGFGYAGTVSGPGAAWRQGLLDGPLAPLRNVHKFDPVLRLVLVLGLIYALAAIAAKARRTPGWGPVAPATAALVVLGAVGSAYPALLGQLAPAGSFASLPSYWDEATQFLAGQEPAGRALLVPAASSGRYLWGTPRDEPIQAYGRSPWLVRDAIPLTQPGTIRMLDGIEQSMAAGRPLVGIADQLAAAGIRYLVIRNDLDSSWGRSPLPSVVHESLRGSDGLSFVADFGPIVGGQLDDGAVVDRGLSATYRAIEIYEVEPYAGLVSIAPLDQVPVVVGGPENVASLRVAGIVGPGPTLLDGERVVSASGPLIQTDGIARRELNPGRVDDNVSARLTVDDSLSLHRRVRDYQVFPDDRADAPAQWLDQGVVTASSSSADAVTPGGAKRVSGPVSAIDGDVTTAWRSAPSGAVDQWVQVTWPQAREVGPLSILMDGSVPGAGASEVTVLTDRGAVSAKVDEDGRVDVSPSPGPTTFVRVTVTSVDGSGTELAAGIREIVGLPPARRTAVAPAPSREPALTFVSATPDGRPYCVHPVGEVVCSDLIARPGEEDAGIDRVVDVGAGRATPLTATAVPLPGGWLDGIIAAADDSVGHTMRAGATSSLVADPEGGPRAAIDRNLETSWIAAADDRDPVLRLTWDDTRTITGIELRERLGLAASRPLSARVIFSDGEVRSGRFDDAGRLRFEPAVQASSMDVSFPQLQRVYSVDPTVGGGTVLPVGVSDLLVAGATPLQPAPGSNPVIAVPCGQGPAIAVGTTLIDTAVRTRLRDLVQRLPLTVDPCDSSGRPASRAVIPGGTQRVLATGGDRWSVRDVLLGDDSVLAEQFRAPNVTAWTSTARAVDVPTQQQAQVLVVRENYSPAWTATMAGQTLEPVRVDGWQQGWIIPAGAGGLIALSVPLDAVYRGGLVLGLLAALVLIGLVIAASVRRPPAAEPAGARRIAPWVAWGVPVIALLVLGGAWGLGCAALVAALAWAWRGSERIRPALAFTAVIVSGACLAFGPWGPAYAGDSILPNVLALLAVALCAIPSIRRRAIRPADDATTE